MVEVKQNVKEKEFIWLPWKISGVPDCAQGYFSRNF